MVRGALALLAPPLCGACGVPAAAAGEPLCAGCAAALKLVKPLALSMPAADWSLAAAPYDGVARAIVSALKFRGRVSLADPMAAAMTCAAGDRLDGHVLVPVPPAPRRRRRRGFDPA